MKKSILLLSVILICKLSVSQFPVNGDFENTTVTDCDYNLTNQEFNAKMYNVTAYGNHAQMDIQTFNCYVDPQNGSWCVGLGSTTNGYDAISLLLSTLLTMNQNYTLEFWTFGNDSLDPVLDSLQVGVSTNNYTLGSHIYTVLPTPGVWEKHSVPFTVSTNAMYISVEIISTLSNSTWVSVDNFSLIPGCINIISNVSESICQGDSIMLGGAYQTISGIYYDTLLAANSCDSIIITDLDVINVNTSVTQNGITLTSNANGLVYQWVDCDLGYFPITGATYQSFTATTNGNYAVIVTEGSCTDTSLCYSVTTVGILDNSFEGDILIYPNPTKDKLNIKLSYNYSDIEIRITDVSGKEVLKFRYANKQSINLDVNNLNPGIYFLQIMLNDNNTFMKFIKE